MFDNDDIQAIAAARYDGIDDFLYEKAVAEVMGDGASYRWMPQETL